MSNNNLFSDFHGAPNKLNIKLVLIGDGATGKTSFFERISKEKSTNYKFNKNYNATHGCNICKLEFKIGKHKLTVHLFDTAGQEKFGTLRDSYLIGCDGIVLMYDLTQMDTKRNVMAKWIPEVKRVLDNSKVSQNIPIIVVGNKNDKPDKVKIKSFDECGIRKAALVSSYKRNSLGSFRYGPIEHCVISVKAGENLMNPINWLLKQIGGYYLPVNAENVSKSDFPVVYS